MLTAGLAAAPLGDLLGRPCAAGIPALAGFPVARTPDHDPNAEHGRQDRPNQKVLAINCLIAISLPPFVTYL